MKTDGHIGLQGEFKSHLNEPGGLGVAMIKAQMPQHDGQPVLLAAYCADSTFNIGDVIAQHCLVREPGGLRIRPLAHGGDQRIGTVGKDLEGEVLRLLLSFGVHLTGAGEPEEAQEEDFGRNVHALPCGKRVGWMRRRAA